MEIKLCILNILTAFLELIYMVRQCQLFGAVVTNVAVFVDDCDINFNDEIILSLSLSLETDTPRGQAFT